MDCVVCRKAGVPTFVTVSLCQAHILDALLLEPTDAELAVAVQEALRKRLDPANLDRPN